MVRYDDMCGDWLLSTSEVFIRWLHRMPFP